MEPSGAAGPGWAHDRLLPLGFRRARACALALSVPCASSRPPREAEGRPVSPGLLIPPPKRQQGVGVSAPLRT